MIWQNQKSPYAIPTAKASELLDVSKSGYYRWLKSNGRDNREAKDKLVVEEIVKIIYEFPGYGYRRITRQLNRIGKFPQPVNHKRVLRLMRENGLIFKHREFKPRTTDPDPDGPVYPNLVRGLEIERPNQIWAADFTYIQLKKEFIYLAVELDIYSRRVIGWALSRSLSKDTALDALYMALYNRRNECLSGLIHHSDRGRQYTSIAFTECLRDHGIQISNSRKGNPYDNAYVESFFKTLKYEEVYLNEYDTFEDAWNNIQAFIEDVYNEKRLHSALEYLPPAEFEQNYENMRQEILCTVA